MTVYKKAYRKIRSEFKRYKRKMTCFFSREDIWESSEKIHFYCCVSEYFEYNQNIPNVYLEMMVVEETPIHAMWEIYLKQDTLSYQTWKGIEQLLEIMLLEWDLPKAG